MPTVNSKMTAIANEIRELSGSNEKMGLDAMANILNTENINLTTETSTYTNELAELQTKITALEDALEGKAGGSSGSGNNTDFENAIIAGELTTYKNDRVKNIGDYVFYYYSSLTSINFPVCTSIGQSAFYSCSSLTSISFPKCTSIGD